MDMQLIDGQFTSADAVALITKMVHAKIQFHEAKITSDSTEEDLKFRERKIKFLQKELFEMRHYIESCGNEITIKCQLTL